MNQRQARFVREYLIDGVGAAAARRAGYSATSAKHAARRLMADPEIASAIEAAEAARARKTEITAQRVIEELGQVAFGPARSAERLSSKVRALLALHGHLADRPDAEASTEASMETWGRLAAGLLALQLEIGLLPPETDLRESLARVLDGIEARRARVPIEGRDFVQPDPPEGPPAAGRACVSAEAKVGMEAVAVPPGPAALKGSRHRPGADSAALAIRAMATAVETARHVCLREGALDPGPDFLAAGRALDQARQRAEAAGVSNDICAAARELGLALHLEASQTRGEVIERVASVELAIQRFGDLVEHLGDAATRRR